MKKARETSTPSEPKKTEQVFIGRENEILHLHQSLAKRESLLICGPPGIGKTALVERTLATLDESLRRRCLYLGGVRGLRELLEGLLTLLFEKRDATLLSQLRAERVHTTTFSAWLKAQPSSRLKGSAYRAAEKGDYRILLDHVPALTRAFAKVVKELAGMRNTPVYLVTREAQAGAVSDLYWNGRQRLALEPLPANAARELLDHCIERFGLVRLNLEEFLATVLSLSECIPGAIVKMCALAAEPQYQSGSHIKTRLIRIDYLMGARKTERKDTDATSTLRP